MACVLQSRVQPDQRHYKSPPHTHTHTHLNTTQISCFHLHLSPPRPRYASCQGPPQFSPVPDPALFFGRRRCHTSPRLLGGTPMFKMRHHVPSYRHHFLILSTATGSGKLWQTACFLWLFFLPISQFVLRAEKEKILKNTEKIKTFHFWWWLNIAQRFVVWPFMRCACVYAYDCVQYGCINGNMCLRVCV